MTARRLAWLAALVFLVAALAVGAQSSGKPETPARRASRLAADFRCPSCRDLSAAQSDAPTAKTLRAEIVSLVEQGRTDAEIRAEIVGRFGSDILLTPPSSGVAGLVWALPVVAFVVALGGLALAFVRGRGRGGGRDAGGPSDHDRRIVEAAMR